MSYWNGSRWVPETPTTPRRRQIYRGLIGAATEASLIVLLVFGLIVGTTLAAKPAPSKIWVSELSSTARVSLELGHAFSVGYETRERAPYAHAWCVPNASSQYIATYPDGSIWSAVYSVYPGGPTPQNFVLGESVYPLWTGGGADCHVALVKYSRDLQRTKVLATTSFSATP